MIKNSDLVLWTLLIPLVCCLAGACNAPVQPAVEVDSVADSVVEPVLQPLPDTAYASTDKLLYQVDCFDSLTDGTISSFEDLYASAPGIFLFRGTPFRDASFYGTVDGRPDTVVVDWTFVTRYDSRVTSLGIWGGGTGWTGQPLYVCWPDSCMARFRKESPALTSSFDKEEIRKRRTREQAGLHARRFR